MSRLATRALATGAVVTMLTLPGLAPAQAAPLGAAPGESATTEAPADRQAPADTPALAEPGTRVQLLGLTDFHGRIVEAGTQVASVVEEQRADFLAEEGAAGTALLSTGDNIGASTYVSSSQQDTPTLDVLNALGLQASAVGNHEFDRGLDDLTGRVQAHADFDHLGANVYEKGTEDVVDGLDDYTVVDVGGVDVAVIGVVTKDTSSLVSPAGIADIEFGDPTDAVNRVAAEIESLPADERPDMTVVEAHLGASSTDSLEAALASNREFNRLVTEADPSIDVLFTGHTHLPYAFEAPVPGDPSRTRPVLEAGSYGSVVGRVELVAEADGTWTAESSELLSTKDKSYESPVVAEVARIVAAADELAKVPGSVVAGTITEDITRAWVRDENGDPVLEDGRPLDDRGAESTLGNLVADALRAGVEDSQLEPADFGITNPGGLRTDLLCEDIYNDERECEVTAAELSEVLPFANDHGVVTMKGADVIGLFEEQWQPAGASRPFLHLGVSKELDVVVDSTAPAGRRVRSVQVNGEEIDPEQDYRVATLSFLAGGGDNFSSFAEGEFELSGLTDFETWVDHFNDSSPVAPDTSERQADLAHDVIATGALTAELEAPSGGIAPGSSADFLLRTDAEAEVPGPVDVTVDLPAGYSGPQTLTLDSIPAGGSTHAVRVTAPAGASGEATVSVSLRAGDGRWWDDNPLPIAHEFTATASVVGAGSDDAGGGSDGGDAGADGGGVDEGGADGGTDNDDSAAGGSADAVAVADGADSRAADDGVRGDDLPRTGVEMMSTVAAALALIVAGSAAIGMARRRRSAYV
ncbi:2',3'-cyclic-nucleotide 2'-phosphodiesterase (5'-nucleotidase family) [Brevibacterium sanguinis]|uniref:2',3'-cyclic-nucleotide 2'-phosphodiesterase (5'-nucleotidase family) n=2 Tax=Brevibacterium TaxID=1696 RepID=A0A366IMT2_9MICO|nr:MULTISPECIES: bifunctional UDP-sugar hydrolase/5'-nucleotidase [Brevibacterium]RBP68189.1 2',3'-cyclic-nucleotide 2'-phosphodiesterase (5'-nucleotidase family) [Brevibacterium sanguinis]RBP74394.1 2',3'-cyclic-nucleotide 2'-phosphodiesterase (5'-nucleotidase family) [Brevibacterium celere]